MKRNIVVEEVTRTPIEEQKIELVERKGIGHPDTIADGIADSISKALCKEYKKNFGIIMHHNTDQVQVVGGMASPSFGGGKVISPIYILLSGRATTSVGEEKIPVGDIAINAAKDYLSATIRNLDVNKDVVLDSKIGQGSADLRDVFKRAKEVPVANDTSFGVGFAPLSEVEKLCLETEKKMNSDEFKKRFPESGEDIKVMGMREKDRITLTIANAMVSKYIPDIDHYKSVKDEMKCVIQDFASSLTEREVEVAINTADDYERGSVYLTVTGTSAEMGDDGSVGRGNRVNGLITPNRYMSLEAAAGKNPVNHVGKMYNLISNQIARDLICTIEEIKEVYVKILSQIGSPIDRPKIVSVQLILQDGKFKRIKHKVESVVDSRLEEITKITDMVIEGELSTF